MFKNNLLYVIFGSLFTLTGCQNMSTEALIGTGVKAFQVASLSNTEVKLIADEACAAYDANSEIAANDSQYAKRLESLTAKLGHTIDGQPLNYKVYVDPDNINAWAMANGCIRVYSGLMDFMNDDEVLGVIGHEIGHVMKGHRLKATKVAYTAEIARDVAAQSSNSIVSNLSQSELGDIAQSLINAQFSQKQEFEADDYSLALLQQKGLDPEGMASAFDKLASLGSKSSMFSTHPDSATRAERMRAQIRAQ